MKIIWYALLNPIALRQAKTAHLQLAPNMSIKLEKNLLKSVEGVTQIPATELPKITAAQNN